MGHFLQCPTVFSKYIQSMGSREEYCWKYCFLTNKRRETYSEVLTQLQHLTNNSVPQSAMLDFEQGMMSALRQQYPLVPQKDCLFHLSKSIFRKVQELGLSQRYINDQEFRTNIRMIAAPSFVPIQDTIEGFEDLANHCRQEEQAVLDYFETTYIGKLRRGRRLQPLFPQTFWNMNKRVQEDLPPTNNEIEGWYSRCSGGFPPYHAHI